MPVTLVDYDEAEARGRAALSPGETWAFTTATLAGCGFPVRVHSEAEIAGFCDFGNNFDLNYAVFARDHTPRVGSLHTAFTAQEARLIRRVSDAAFQRIGFASSTAIRCSGSAWGRRGRPNGSRSC